MNNNEEKFTETVLVRMLPEHKQDIHKSINQSNKYTNISHFIRCAIIKLIREELHNE